MFYLQVTTALWASGNTLNDCQKKEIWVITNDQHPLLIKWSHHNVSVLWGNKDLSPCWGLLRPAVAVSNPGKWPFTLEGGKWNLSINTLTCDTKWIKETKSDQWGSDVAFRLSHALWSTHLGLSWYHCSSPLARLLGGHCSNTESSPLGTGLQ